MNMRKRSASNYSLWPEQARPRRGKGLTLAAGGFAIGIACAIAANNVISDVINPPPDQDIPRQVTVEDYAPIYATPVFSPAIIPPPPAEEASTTGAAVTPTPAALASRPAASVAPTLPKSADSNKVAKPARDTAPVRNAARAPAEVTRPAVGAYAAGPSSATDGRGGDGAVGPTTLGALNPVLGTRLTDEEEGPSARDGTIRREGASAPATTRPAVKKPPKRTREQAKKKKRNYRRSNYAVRHRAGPVYGSRGQSMSGGGGADY